MAVRQPSPAPSSPLLSSLGISRGGLTKALFALLLIWVVAAMMKFSGHSDLAVGTGAKGEDLVTSPGSGQSKDGVIATPPTKIKHTDRAAVIIENRPSENLIPVILHFQSVLGPEWPIIFYTIPTTADALALSPAFARAIEENKVQVRFIPPEVTFSSHKAVSLFLADAWIWENLAPYKKILLFQTDSIICSQSTATIDDFVEYDLIGAPIAAQYGKGFNGGLSIRNRELTLDVFSMHSYANDSSVPGAPANMQFEDQWLFTRMSELPPKKDGSPGANLPNEETAKKFAVETIWQEKPFGFHQPTRWQKDNMASIMKYCPEVGMISGAAFF